MQNKLITVSLLVLSIFLSSMTLPKTKLLKSSPPPAASLFIFLKFDPIIAGGSTSFGNENEFNVLSFDFGVTKNLYEGGNTLLASTGPPNGSDINIVLNDAISGIALAPLFLNICKGTHLNNATISIKIATGNSTLQEIELIELRNAIVTSVNNDGDDSANGTTKTSISLNFESISRNMYSVSQTGIWTAGTPVTWNYRTNQP